MYKIKLQPGDYARRDMGEDKYRECAKRFLDDGCPVLDDIGGWASTSYFGWATDVHRAADVHDKSGFSHFSSENRFGNRLLTYEQIMEKEEVQIGHVDNLSFDNIFELIAEDKAEAADMKFRADILLVMRKLFEKKGWTQCDIMLCGPGGAGGQSCFDSSWHEKGELPPVGTVVEFYHDKKDRNEGIKIDDWKNGDELEILAFRDVLGKHIPVVFNLRDRSASCIILKYIRPIKSEREKAIEEMYKILSESLGVPDLDTQFFFTAAIHALYDAGYRKTESRGKRNETNTSTT